MSTRVMEFGISHEGEHAYITKPNKRGDICLYPSRPLKAGMPVYRIITRYQRPNRPPVEDRTAFRSLAHAKTWIDATTYEKPS